MCDGNLLLSLVFDTMLTAVCTNTLESDVFIGTNNGGILQFSLHSAPRTKEYHLSTEEKAPVFVGHTKSITCLSNSLDGELLLSGSVDETAKIWHIFSKQCLRTFIHKGQVTNAFFTIAPKQMFNNELTLSVYLSSFKKSEEEGSEVITVFTNTDLKLHIKTRSSRSDDFDYYKNGQGMKNTDYTNSLENKLEKAKSINKQLYNFAINSILETDKHTELCKNDVNTTEDGSIEESDDNLVEQDMTSEENMDKLRENVKLKKNLKKPVSFQNNQTRKIKRHRKKKKIFSL